MPHNNPSQHNTQDLLNAILPESQDIISILTTKQSEKIVGVLRNRLKALLVKNSPKAMKQSKIPYLTLEEIETNKEAISNALMHMLTIIPKENKTTYLHFFRELRTMWNQSIYGKEYGLIPWREFDGKNTKVSLETLYNISIRRKKIEELFGIKFPIGQEKSDTQRKSSTKKHEQQSTTQHPNTKTYPNLQINDLNNHFQPLRFTFHFTTDDVFIDCNTGRYNIQQPLRIKLAKISETQRDFILDTLQNFMEDNGYSFFRNQ